MIFNFLDISFSYAFQSLYWVHKKVSDIYYPLDKAVLK